MNKGTNKKQTASTTEGVQTKRRHKHLSDLGFSSLIAYFFCLTASVSIRSGSPGVGLLDGGALFPFFVFIGTASLTLLILALMQGYLLRHDNHRGLALIAGAFLALGPAFNIINYAINATTLFPAALFFGFSGIGYALSLLVWGRILSKKNTNGSSHQVLADSSVAVIVMAVILVLPDVAYYSVLVSLGLLAGAIGSLEAVSAAKETNHKEATVINATRSVIPRAAVFAGSVLWLVFGIFMALLNDVQAINGYLNVATIVVALVASVAGIAIVRLHKKPDINLSKMSWISVPLLVMALVVYVAGNQNLLGVAVVLVVFGMTLSYLHLMAHFASLAHRGDLLCDQMFTWGWLAPYGGMSIGVLIGMISLLIDGSAVDLFISVVAGVLVVSLIVSMLNIEKIAIRRRVCEEAQKADEENRTAYEIQMNELFSAMGLSQREQDVALLMLQGRSQAVIAEQLYVAPSTVNTHVKHIYRKVNVGSKQEFIDLCHERLNS